MRFSAVHIYSAVGFHTEQPEAYDYVYVKQLSGVGYASVKRTYSTVALVLPISTVVSGVA